MPTAKRQQQSAEQRTPGVPGRCIAQCRRGRRTLRTIPRTARRIPHNTAKQDSKTRNTERTGCKHRTRQTRETLRPRRQCTQQLHERQRLRGILCCHIPRPRIRLLHAIHERTHLHQIHRHRQDVGQGRKLQEQTHRVVPALPVQVRLHSHCREKRRRQRTQVLLRSTNRRRVMR